MNKNLSEAKAAKNDEFYTQYRDIEHEMNAYLEYNPDAFRNKVVLCPCDDPEWSKFTLYFAQRFEYLGLKKLISTSYAQDAKRVEYPYSPSLFETENEHYEESKTQTHGKIFVLDRDKNKDGRIDYRDIDYTYLDGTGDFKSEEVKKFRDEADIIVTNPPFSLFRDFMNWIMEANKQFLIIGNMNAITYKEVFPLIKENKIWSGAMLGHNMYFKKPNSDEMTSVTAKWFTNIEHGRRHEPMILMTYKDNLRFSKHKSIREDGYKKYDNYDALNVDYVDAIPDDYDGVMGVPISFMDRYSPEQFEIVGLLNNGHDNIYDYDIPVVDGKRLFKRILIRHIRK